MSQTENFSVASIYAKNAIVENADDCDIIDATRINSIPDLFQQRVKRSAEKTAYCQYDPSQNRWLNYTWGAMAGDVMNWRRAFAKENLEPQDRVAIRLCNSREWVLFDQAALAQGLVVVPVYVEDRADNIAYILEHTDSKFLFLEEISQWLEMSDELSALSALDRVVVISTNEDELSKCDDPRVVSLEFWLSTELPIGAESVPDSIEINPDDLATIVYTSGTTGKPKGVMLSHANMLLNAYGGLHNVAVFPTDLFLSFLPLSHMFERTVGYYLTMMAGAGVAFNRSIPELLDDLAAIKPTAMISVPRIFERAASKIREQLDEGPKIKKWLFEKAVEIGWQKFELRQGRGKWKLGFLFWPILNSLVARKVVQRFGGRLRFVVSGGARLAPNIARTFIGLGIDILQGYGLTETSPILTVNTLDKNKPSSIGLPLPGAQLRLGENNELQAKGPYIMAGYWKNPEATADTFGPDGWLMTGDVASITDDGFVSITGRIKEIIVLANGEKAPPADMESAICDDNLFEQVMVIGEGKAYLTAILVLNNQMWPKFAQSLGVDHDQDSTLEDEKVKAKVLQRIAHQLLEFPGYAFIRYVTLSTKSWGVEDGSITPTLKLKRPVLMKRFEQEITAMYARK